MFQFFIVLLIVIGMNVAVQLLQDHISANRLKKVLLAVFVAYACSNLYFTILSRTVGSGTTLELQPFRVYHNLFEATELRAESVSGVAAYFLRDASPIINIALNILLYYPLGYLLPILFPKLKTKHVIMIGCLCSIATEATQYLLKMGWCETDDVIYNTLGTAIGVWVWLWRSKRLNARRSTSPEVVEKKPGQN